MNSTGSPSGARSIVVWKKCRATLDDWLREYNAVRPHQGRWCYGKTPMQTFVDSVALAREKILSPAALEQVGAQG